MAGVATPELAAAVSNAGALGSLGIGASDVEAAEAMIARTATLTDKPFNVNVFAHEEQALDPAAEAAWLARLAPQFERFGIAAPRALRPLYPSFQGHEPLLAMLCATRPAVVSFHFGCPAPQAVRRLKEAGIVLMASATSLDEALKLEAAGMDALVAQGFEAGGHRGTFDGADADADLPLDSLLARIVGAVRVPVVAAGGLMDGADIARVLAAGAAAAQLGTAFVGCPESAAGAFYRARLSRAVPGETRMTRAISGRRARGLVTPLIEALHPFEEQAPAYPYPYDAARQLAAAAAGKGDHSLSAMWAGAQAHRARALPAADLVARLAAELAAASP